MTNSFLIPRLFVFLILFFIVLDSSIVNLSSVFAIEPLLPQFEPTVHTSSNPNLYVSAENSFFKNYFAGPQVIEVIVTDPDINRLDQAYGEPDVTVNGKKLRMAQASDGNWYGYFADVKQAQIADATQIGGSGKGLDFGKFCSSSSAGTATGVDFSETNGIAIARSAPGSADGTSSVSNTITTTCTGLVNHAVSSITGDKSNLLDHVIRENKTLNTNAPGGRIGQISSPASNQAFVDAWPIIQLYDFSGFPTPVTIQYAKAGSVQSVTLVFDRIPSNMIGIVSNRAYWPRGGQVHGDLIDPQLNVDPTEEDSWTWGTSASNNTLFYQVFDRSGNLDADGTAGMQNLMGNLSSMMFNHNGKLTQDPAPQGVVVGKLQSNDVQKLFKGDDGFLRTKSISGLSIPITVLELQPNVGILGDYGASAIAEIVILDDAKLEKSFTVRYNDVSYTVLVRASNAKLTMG